MDRKKEDTTDCIYLDYNGTTPIRHEAFETMIPYLTSHFGNPSSSHAYGAEPRLAIEKARVAILSLLFDDNDDTTIETNNNNDNNDETKTTKTILELAEESIVFTGCGTEADNLAIRLALASRPGRNHIVTSNVEHPAVEEYLRALEMTGEIEVTRVPVGNDGTVSATDVVAAIRPEGTTALITLMFANNETGAIQPVREVSIMLADSANPYRGSSGVLIHTDAAQAVGKVSVSIDDYDGGGIGPVDMVTIVGHKFGAPKGVAALYVRPGCVDDDSNGGRSIGYPYGSSGMVLVGGGQERGKRAGTENVASIAAMGRAAELLMERREGTGNGNIDDDCNDKIWKRAWEVDAKRYAMLRDRLLLSLTEGLGKGSALCVHGPVDPQRRLPNTLYVGLRNIHGPSLLRSIEGRVACSAGSACHSSSGPGAGTGEVSYSSVLKAMNVPKEFAIGTLRLSCGRDSTADEIDRAAAIILEEVKKQIEEETL